MKKMVATKSMVYHTRRLQAGDQFDASDRDARILAAIGKAKASEPAKRRQTRVMTAPPVKAARAPVIAAEPEQAAQPPVEVEDLSLLTNAELRLTAEREGVDVSVCKLKAELVEAIEAARAGAGK
jgi:hypothetical protein